MRNAEINAEGELVVTASQTSSASDFDFLLGEHNVQHRKLKARLADSDDWEEFNGSHKMEPLLNGIGNLEQHVMDTLEGRTEGIALRLFNPATRLWSIHWANGRSGILEAPVVGSFDGQTGFFYGNDNYRDRHFRYSSNGMQPTRKSQRGAKRFQRTMAKPGNGIGTWLFTGPMQKIMLNIQSPIRRILWLQSALLNCGIM